MKVRIFLIFFALVFVDLKNISQLIQSGKGTRLNNAKHLFYNLLKIEWVDWRKILTNFSRQFLKITKSKGDATDISSPKCLIIDDTLLCKTGKTIEHIGKVVDHCSRTFQFGMKNLVCGLWERKSFIPTAFSVDIEPGKNRNRGMKNKELANQFY